ncbi:Protein of unknown function [Bacillus cytotoxicus]|uniref:Uncharacterized protein n=1 Tax=Bacillus cytotoxicus TaxID=580165 RepID=A0AAX2CCT0_9BACI|nr:Protein of unknown function [Bacillus cytotoxicus]SCN31375.1 Protein of unknown function [Bacillus cytotoxicus]
MMDVSLHQSG